MDIIADWNDIRRHFNKSFASNFHVAVASVDAGHCPTVTPIGSLFLNDDQTGFYFEKFPSRLPAHAEANNNVCVLAVNSHTRFWLVSLFRGRFDTFPAIKLYGTLGEKRVATESEIGRLNKRMRRTRGLRGHQYLWGDMKTVRTLHFTSAEAARLGAMTAHL